MLTLELFQFTLLYRSFTVTQSLKKFHVFLEQAILLIQSKALLDARYVNWRHFPYSNPRYAIVKRLTMYSSTTSCVTTQSGSYITAFEFDFSDFLKQNAILSFDFSETLLLELVGLSLVDVLDRVIDRQRIGSFASLWGREGQGRLHLC